ncbi:MAG: response regulator transcription factor [Clostridia bacterium]|nr:response regulator transcription factor [Clostridia bacterium]
MRVCICEDIAEYRDSVRCYSEQFFKDNNIDYTIDEFDSGESLLSSECLRDYDIFLIDIELKGINGIEVINILTKQGSKAFFIVITAYKKYLDEAMDLKVLRFVEKPIKQDKMYSVLKKAVETINESVIELKAMGGQSYFIKQTDIIYAEARFKKSYVFLDNLTIVSTMPFREIKNLLISTEFLIPHNSYIVNKNHITYIQRNMMKVKLNNNEVSIPISATKQKIIKKEIHG